ncbi:MAG: XdhC family protein [Kiritimatiellae bacterium]|nr:XdhC family protein [Kiritimatiellia bacterium]
MSLREVMNELKTWSSEGRACGIAILYQAQHSSPRPVGACLAVAEDGRMAGAISMGCVESDIRENLLDLLQNKTPPRLLHYGAADDMLLEIGLTCGGEIDVLIARFDPEHPVWSFLHEKADRFPCALFLVIHGPCAGELRCLSADGSEAGAFTDPRFESIVQKETPALFKHKRSQCFKNEQDEKLFAQYFAPPTPLAIIGGNPIAMALCDLAARIGFDVTIIDPRSSVAPAEYYPAARAVIHEWPEAAMQTAGVDNQWCIAVLSHDQKLDVPAIETALLRNCRYIGLLGSKATQQKRREALLERGVTEERLNTVYGPIGFKGIGAITSAEIAVSILAEIIASLHHAPLAGR